MPVAAKATSIEQARFCAFYQWLKGEATRRLGASKGRIHGATHLLSLINIYSPLHTYQHSVCTGTSRSSAHCTKQNITMPIQYTIHVQSYPIFAANAKSRNQQYIR